MQRLVADEHLIFTDHSLFRKAESLHISDANQAHIGPPVWLTMHLIANCVRTRGEAKLALDLAINQLRFLPKPYRFPVCLLAIHRLLKFSQMKCLTDQLETVLHVPSTTPDFHYNELLAVCGRFPKSNEAYILVKKILEYMRDNSIPINRHVATSLNAYAISYADISALLPKVPRKPRYSHVARYHVPSTLEGFRRHRRTSQLSKLSLVEVLKGLAPSIPETRPLRMDAHEWSTLITRISRDQNVDVQMLRAFWDRIQAHRGNSMDIASQTAIMDGFRQRGQYEDALLVWKSVLKRPATIDKRALTAGILSLCGATQYKEAFETMDTFAFKDYLPSENDPTWPVAYTQWIERRGAIKLDTATMNALMDRLNRAGRPDVVFKLWDVMEKYYCVWPDGITMTILLDAARRAYLIDPSMELALGQLGIFNPFKRFWTRYQPPETPSIGISRMLSGPPESGFWHGDWAFVNARVIFRDVILGNWPHLRQVECPVGTYTPSSISDRLWTTKDRAPELRWPTVIPFDTTFHAYIFLLGWNELQAEIPLALAWMKALQIQPLHKTLCAALMYFGEVARLPPLFEPFELKTKREYGGDYGRLRRWIADWVGEGALPSENMVAAYRRGDGTQKMRWHGRRY
jgi:hypothetical protein